MRLRFTFASVVSGNGASAAVGAVARIFRKRSSRVMKRLRAHFTYANAMATIAVVVAVGTGSSYAVDKLSGSRLENRSVGPKKIKRNALTGAEIRERSLGIVPRALRAFDLSGYTVEELLDRCQGDMTVAAGMCVEKAARAPATYMAAAEACDFNHARHLPTHEQLIALLRDQGTEVAAVGGEFIGPLVTLSTGPVIGVVTEREQPPEAVAAFGGEQRAYRCAVAPRN